MARGLFVLLLLLSEWSSLATNPTANSPTPKPSPRPTPNPTTNPSPKPTAPTPNPTVNPTVKPTHDLRPTGQPSGQPSKQPVGKPSGQPSLQPSGQPTGQPTTKAVRYSEYPTGQPTSAPSGPTGQPTGQPTSAPSSTPNPTVPDEPTLPPVVPPPIVLPPQLASRSFGYEVDVYWEFNVAGSLEGWGNATAEQMQMELTVINGEMRGSIVGDNPKVDSPLLFIGVTDRHYTIIRMMYYGESYNARLLMRSGSSPTGRGHNENNNPAYWNGRQPVQAVDSSPSANETKHGRSKSVDGDKYSYYLSSSPAGVYVVFDLGNAQWIREVRILPSGDSNSPKRCLLQMSTTNGQGPFTTVTSFNFPNPLTGVYAEPASPPPPEPYYQPQKQSLAWSFYGNRTHPKSTTTQVGRPTGQPTRQPTGQPTRQPTRHPTGQPSRQPTRQPTGQPSTHPTLNIMKGASDFNFSRSDSSKATSRKIDELSVSAFDGLARYWRLLVIDNYGGPGVGIREVSFWGYSEEVSVSPFSIDNTAKYKNYYIPLFPYVSGNLLRLRVELMPNASVQTAASVARGSRYREAMSIDYIRVAKAPAVWRVRGCLDKYYETASRQDQPQYKVKTMVKMINGHLPLRYFVKEEMQLPYADTYDCSPSGGNVIKVEGLYFGPKAIVFIGGKECVRQGYSTDGSFETILCSTPPSGGHYGTQTLRVQNGVLPGLFQDVPFFSYRNAPPVQLTPVVTNYGARRVDLVWEPPGTNALDHMMTTGYKVLWFQPKYPNRVSNLTVGNVTTTSIRGLEPATEYIFAVAPMAEGAFLEKSASLETDLYGRRDPTHDALIGTFSPYTNVSATLLYDFNFGLFNANATLNASAVQNVSSNGPTGVWGGEGNYGLVLVGSANVQNCNVSSTCCDGYNATIGLASCGVLPTVCAVLPSRVLAYDYVIEGVTRRQTGTNLPYSNGAPQEIAIFTLEELQKNKGAALPTSSCGPALRLTPSEARQSGATWYGRKVNVREGFDTTITFEISQPSQLCDRMDDVNTFCRSRGADGFAFVVQNVDITALGVAGYGMGYEGIFNSLAVELDTYHNYDMMDFYENHVAVMTQGWRYNISANHSRALATTNRVPDLTDGRHSVRIKYDPNFDDTAVPHPSFQINGFTTWFLENADFLYGGMGDWGKGFGLLYVYVDDMYSPVLTTALNLDKTLNLDDGRAYIGLTAATGVRNWQNHDILGWQFTSLHIDDNYTPPPIVNGEGAYQCINETVCVNHIDYDHYMRQNNKYSDGRPYVGLSGSAPINPRTTITWSDVN